ncbi:MAG: anhydro-N-acetylmuramic acid kinase [Chitinispirillaceae bacterium]|nr:anhydro-N-acetylmuramic acid kinase [Chitinispirillaceae bacterium]
MQCLYVLATGDSWEIISHAFIPFPHKIAAQLDIIHDDSGNKVSSADLALLDYRMSLLYTESARTTLAKLPTALKKPHCAILNKVCLWKGPTGEDQQQTYWDLPIGDAQHLAGSLGIPVLTDLIRHRCIAGGKAALPDTIGNIRLAAAVGGTVLFINIGLVARMTVVDTRKSEILIDSDTGPGTCCINSVMQRITAGTDSEKIDRDGTLAAQGTVNGECLQRLSDFPWFSKPAPKQAAPELFEELAADERLATLSDADRLATITALTARSIYNFYRTESRFSTDDQTVLLSGGGSNNQTLTRYIATYFDSIPVKNVERYGIPADMRIPLALGLTVNTYIGGTPIPWETGSNPTVQPMGKWVLP